MITPYILKQSRDEYTDYNQYAIEMIENISVPEDTPLDGNKDGYIVQYKKCRGRKSALNELISLVCDNIVDSENQIIGIAHADAYEDSLYIMEQIQKRIKVRDFINTSYDFCTGSHVGPDTIALFFMAKDRELSGK